jgi:hypothetical protein
MHDAHAPPLAGQIRPCGDWSPPHRSPGMSVELMMPVTQIVDRAHINPGR